MKTKLICLCHYATVDKNTSNLSIINLINIIRGPNLPLMIPESCLVLLSEREKGDHQKIEVEVFVKLNKKLLINKKVEIDYLDKKLNQFIVNIHGLVIDQVGKLIFIVKKDNKQIAKYECAIELIPTIKTQQKSKS